MTVTTIVDILYHVAPTALMFMAINCLTIRQLTYVTSLVFYPTIAHQIAVWMGVSSPVVAAAIAFLFGAVLACYQYVEFKDHPGL